MKYLSDLPMALIVIAFLVVLTLKFEQDTRYELKAVEIQQQNKLREYELITERKRAEAQLIYAKALEVSCSSELVNKWGDRYARN
jgi:hypothetical protein